MSKYIPGNQKHLTLEDRIYIEDELNRGTTFKDIAKFLCKDPTTISKEVKAHRISDWYHKGTFYNAKNFCVHRYHCRKTNACGKIILCGVKCSSCPTCNQTCRDFEKERCSRLDKAPYVCNGCPKKISQSPYQIVTNHPELELSVRTLYSYLDQGLFTARNVDLKRKVKCDMLPPLSGGFLLNGSTEPSICKLSSRAPRFLLVRLRTFYCAVMHILQRFFFPHS